jgi:ABC-type transport system involved in multi-copper enzyme maturation permease subunit
MFVNKFVWLGPVFLLFPTIIIGTFVYRERYITDVDDWLGGFTIISLFLFLQFFILFFPLLYSGSLFTEEIEKRTITYIMIKPLKRFEFVLFKYIGMVIGLFLLFIPAVTVAFLVAMARPGLGQAITHLEVLGWMLFVILLGLMTYGAIYTLLSVLTKHPLIFGLLFAFIWEVFVVNIGGSVKRMTIMFYLRSILYQEIYSSEFGGFTDMAGTHSSILICAGVIILCLAAAMTWITYKDLH